MPEEAKPNVEEVDVAGHELQKFISRLIMEPAVTKVTLIDKAGQSLMEIPVDNPAYMAQGYRTAMPSIMNKLGIIRAKVPQVRVKIKRRQ